VIECSDQKTCFSIIISIRLSKVRIFDAAHGDVIGFGEINHFDIDCLMVPSLWTKFSWGGTAKFLRYSKVLALALTG